MAFGTYKPCHGCGSKGWKSVNTLCEPCQGLLRAGKALKRATEVEAEKKTAFRLSREWPLIYIPSSDTEVSRRLERALAEVARVALKPLRSKKDPYSKGVLELPPQNGRTFSNSNTSTATLWTGTERAAKALITLDERIREAVDHAYAEGKRDGSNFLMQIAKGEISIRELSDAHIEAGRNTQNK